MTTALTEELQADMLWPPELVEGESEASFMRMLGVSVEKNVEGRFKLRFFFLPYNNIELNIIKLATSIHYTILMICKLYLYQQACKASEAEYRAYPLPFSPEYRWCLKWNFKLANKLQKLCLLSPKMIHACIKI